MNYAQELITHATTGVKTWTLGWQAVEAVLEITPSPGTTLAYIRRSRGCTNGTDTNCDVETIHSSGGQIFQRRFTDRFASIQEYTAGAWVEVYRINFDSITATEVKYNVVTASATFQVRRIARG